MNPKRIIIAGGTGFLGQVLCKRFNSPKYEVVVLTRHQQLDYGNVHFEYWDGVTTGPWAQSLEGAEAVINLAGKSVDCRYNQRNRHLIYESRLNATHVIGTAIKACQIPPKVWINAASATIYRHALDKDMDEQYGEMGKGFSVDVCRKWEQAFHQHRLAYTRKVLTRIAIVLSKDGGALLPLTNLARIGLGGKQGNGKQYFSWLHADDFSEAINFIIENDECSGTYNLSSPNPLPNKQFMTTLRKAMHIPVGIPLPKWLLEVGAVIIRTEPELILKSRRVVPKRLIDAGFEFKFKYASGALGDLLSKPAESGVLVPRMEVDWM